MAISAPQAFALVDRVFKHLTSQLMSSMSIKGLDKSGSDEFLPQFQKDITTAILVNGFVDKRKAMVFLGLDNLDELYLFLIYCKRLNEDPALWERYVDAYYPPFDPRDGAVFDDKKFYDDGKNKFLNTTWVSLLYYLANEDSELTSELEDKSKELFPKPEPEPNKNSGKLVAANSLMPDSFPSKEEKAGWYGIVDAMLGLATVFTSLYNMIPIVVKKIEHIAISTKPEKKSAPRSDAAIVTASQSSTSTTEKTTVDSQNIFGMFGKILYSAFSLTTVPGVLGVQRHDSGNKRPGPSPAA